MIMWRLNFSDTVDDIDNLIEKGYDREKKRKYYKIYYNDEDQEGQIIMAGGEKAKSSAEYGRQIVKNILS